MRRKSKLFCYAKLMETLVLLRRNIMRRIIPDFSTEKSAPSVNEGSLDQTRGEFGRFSEVSQNFAAAQKKCFGKILGYPAKRLKTSLRFFAAALRANFARAFAQAKFGINCSEAKDAFRLFLRRRIILALGTAICLCVSFFPGFAQAQTSRQEVISGKGIDRGQAEGKDKDWQRKREELLRLKNENPEKFKQLIAQRQQQVKERLEQLRQADPKKYGEVMDKIRQVRLERLKKLRQEDPERFRQLIEGRRAAVQDRLEKLKTENPQRYERIMEYRKKLEELRRLRQEDPEKFRDYLNSHPRLRQGLENIRDRNRGEGSYGRRRDIRDNDAASDRGRRERPRGPKY